jgi:hypothetical protein
MTTHDNPEYGQPNYLYANLRNLGPNVARAVSIDFWIAPASVGLAWPADFTYVGRISTANLPVGSSQVGPLTWNPPPPMPSDHYCFYVRVTSPQDRITFAETADVGVNAQNSNNLVWRNINVVNMHSSTSVTFLVRNIGKEDGDVDLAIDIPKELLAAGQAEIALSRGLERAWPEERRKAEGLESLRARYAHAQDEKVDGYPVPPPYRLKSPKVVLRGFRLKRRQAEPVVMTFRSPSKARASFDVHVVERIADKPVGGILYIVRTGEPEGRKR